MQLNKYILHWDGNKTEEAEGVDPPDAFRRAGYGSGALRALDWIEPVDEWPSEKESA